MFNRKKDAKNSGDKNGQDNHFAEESININDSEMFVTDNSQVQDSFILDIDKVDDSPYQLETKKSGPSKISLLISKLLAKKSAKFDDGQSAISTIVIDSQISSDQLKDSITSNGINTIKNLPLLQLSLTGLAILSAVGAGFAINARSTFNEKITLASSAVVEVQGVARNIPKLAKSAAFGDKSAISSIESFTTRIEENSKRIVTYSDDKKLMNYAKQSVKAVAGISSRKDKLYGVGDSLVKVRSSGEMVKGAAEQLQSIVLQKNASEEVALVSARLRNTASRMNARIDDIVSGSSPAAAITAFNNDIAAILDVMALFSNNASLTDPDIAGRMNVLKQATNELRGYSTEIRASLLDVVEARRSAEQLTDIAELIIASTDSASKNLENSRGDLGNYQLVAAVLALLSVMLLAGIFLVNAKSEKRRAKTIETQKRNTENAIERMLGEIVPISGGDLRTRITVTDDVTGVIADAVNLTIDELSRVVIDINKSSVDVEKTTSAFVITIEQIAVLVTEQAGKVEGANQSVSNLTDSINQISQSAERSYEVAQQSLEAADTGVATVAETINGMNQIRDNIAETSKRIKRLGESSQEIGEIADVIMDITNKTNILALNAFVQAASAGEQGRGFSVIANEIQELAKRSNEALGSVNGLIQAIQGDMREAISAMERSSNGVVEGTSFANAAGDALKKIKDISENLAELVAGISNAAHSQTDDAEQVSRNMQEVLKIANDSAVLANDSKTSVVQISVTVNELSKSVAGFQA